MTKTSHVAVSVPTDKGVVKGAVPPSGKSAGPALPVRGEFLRRLACHPGAKIHSLRICRPGLRGPGKLSCGQFSPSNGPAGPGCTSSVRLRLTPPGPSGPSCVQIAPQAQSAGHFGPPEGKAWRGANPFRGWYWRGKNSPANRLTHSCVSRVSSFPFP